ncbi:MAG: hypothetical protein IKP55_03075 [Clostridia bacterium]|nr:hypothetical protein [Clostridia bacterium]
MTQKNTAHVFYRFFLLIYCLIDAAYALVFAGFIASVVAVDHDASGVALVAVIGGLILAAPTLWSLWMFLHYRRVVLTDVQTVELTRTSTTYLQRVGFTVTVSVGGETREVTTPSVFLPGVFGPNLLDDYSGKTVEIGHDEKWDEWIVLCSDNSEERPL